MNYYTFGVQEPYKGYLIKGKKTIEGRLNKGKFAEIQKGDILEMKSGEKFLVERKDHYISFKEMLEKKGLERVLPRVSNINEGIKVYRKFYSLQQEKEFGVIAISVSKM